MSALRESFKPEQEPHNVVAISPSEQLQNPTKAAEIWAEQNTNHPDFLRQVSERAKHAQAIDQLNSVIPNPTTTIEAALATGTLTIRQAEAAYRALSELLRDIDYERLTLYLPFEFLPRQGWYPDDEYLQESVTEFRNTYLQAWRNLLAVEDVRANFVDGDVLETDLRTEDLPRVVKAAHLAPKLVECGLLTAPEVIDIYTHVDEPLLKSNLAESLMVLADMGYITTAQLKYIGIAHEAASESEVSIDSAKQLQQIEQNYKRLLLEQGEPLTVDVTVNRKTWLERKLLDDAVAANAMQVGDAIRTFHISLESLLSVLPFDHEDLASQVLVEAIQYEVEQTAMNNDVNTEKLFTEYLPVILEFAGTDKHEVTERVKKFLRRANKLGLIGQDELSQLGIDLPKLAGTLSENLASMPDVITAVESMTQIIATDPHLSAFMVPVISIGGSRLKGYGEQTSDIDLCVFIKPGVSYSTRRDMRAYISEFFKGQGMEEHPIELWLNDANETLNIRDFNNDDQLVADSTWAHILFDTVLIGEAENVQMLTQKLLPSYFQAQEIDEFGWSPRAFYLERIEQNLLQYRLLHKGYERHYPRVSKIDSPHADLIDGASVFWDSGYRRLATKLFVDRVFLPKI